MNRSIARKGALSARLLAASVCWLLLLSPVSQARTPRAQGLQQRIKQGPRNQQAKIGDQVVLKCQIEHLAGEPQWCIDDFCLGFSGAKETTRAANNSARAASGQQTLKGRPRHKIVGDPTQGEYHLLIEPVQLQDNMHFFCMATAALVGSKEVRAVKSERVFLTVLSKSQHRAAANLCLCLIHQLTTVLCCQPTRSR